MTLEQRSHKNVLGDGTKHEFIQGTTGNVAVELLPPRVVVAYWLFLGCSLAVWCCGRVLTLSPLSVESREAQRRTLYLFLHNILNMGNINPNYMCVRLCESCDMCLSVCLFVCLFLLLPALLGKRPNHVIFLQRRCKNQDENEDEDEDNNNINTDNVEMYILLVYTCNYLVICATICPPQETIWFSIYGIILHKLQRIWINSQIPNL